jgi:two-component system sensor histidine kinase/response regulator
MALVAKILVIEDETIIREEVLTWLEVEGYEVIGANNGKQGLELIFQDRPDLVLCDINMPEMDGHDVLIALRSNPDYSLLPFIFLTAAADRESMRKGMRLGADDYITKPFTYKEVAQAVTTRLGKQHYIRDQIEQLTDLIDEERELRLVKSRLVSMFSHDFRNPLATILSSSNMLQSYSDRLSPEQKQQKLRRIDGAVHKLIQMLDEMLMVAQVENGQLSFNPQATDLARLIIKVLDNFELIDGGKHEIVLNIDLSETVVTDPNLIQHIITNLVSNALKYSPRGTSVHVKAYEEAGQIKITVRDQGIGIPEDDLRQIFEPFFRAENAQIAKGSGLGLSLVKAAVTVCGGTIQVTSKVEQGSVFMVAIPFTSN